jgi:hypothetical protein
MLNIQACHQFNAFFSEISDNDIYLFNIFSICFQPLRFYFEQFQDYCLIRLLECFEHVLNIVRMGFQHGFLFMCLL